MPSKLIFIPPPGWTKSESIRETDGRLLLDNSLEPTRVIESVRESGFFSPTSKS